jgi:hypothetical protein
MEPDSLQAAMRKRRELRAAGKQNDNLAAGQDGSTAKSREKVGSNEVPSGRRAAKTGETGERDGLPGVGLDHCINAGGASDRVTVAIAVDVGVGGGRNKARGTAKNARVAENDGVGPCVDDKDLVVRVPPMAGGDKSEGAIPTRTG